MTTELNLLKDLTEAFDAVRVTESAAWDAYKRAYTIDTLAPAAAVAARIAADTVAAHAKHELAAALSAARSHVAANTGKN